jgi:hypothetical protein
MDFLQRQRSQHLTSASGDAIWGAHRPNYIHGQSGGIVFAPLPPGGFYQTDFPPLSCSVLRGPALLRPYPSGAPAGLAPYSRWPLDSIRRRSGSLKIADLSGNKHIRTSNWHKKTSGLDACALTKRAARRDENLHLADYNRHKATPLGPLVNPSYSVVVRKTPC